MELIGRSTDAHIDIYIYVYIHIDHYRHVGFAQLILKNLLCDLHSSSDDLTGFA